MASLRLNSLACTARLAEALALSLAPAKIPALLLRGGLGCGKTTLTSFLIRRLPGGDASEPASPSFNLCNFYPTIPPVLHCDLFRCRGALPEELGDAIEQGDSLVIVEWAEYLPPWVCPDNYLDIFFWLDNNVRLLELTPSGSAATTLLARAMNLLPAL